MAKKDKPLKFNLGFWQLFVILVVAAGCGVIVSYYAYGNVVQDEVNSISFFQGTGSPKTGSKTTTKTPVKKPAVKTTK